MKKWSTFWRFQYNSNFNAKINLFNFFGCNYYVNNLGEKLITRFLPNKQSELNKCVMRVKPCPFPFNHKDLRNTRWQRYSCISYMGCLLQGIAKFWYALSDERPGGSFMGFYAMPEPWWHGFMTCQQNTNIPISSQEVWCMTRSGVSWNGILISRKIIKTSICPVPTQPAPWTILSN